MFVSARMVLEVQLVVYQCETLASTFFNYTPFPIKFNPKIHQRNYTNYCAVLAALKIALIAPKRVGISSTLKLVLCRIKALPVSFPNCHRSASLTIL